MPEEADQVMRLADLLLPGDDLFPAASASGMAELLMVRLRAAEAGLVAHLIAALGEPSAEAVARLEAAEPGLFDSLRKIVFATYYEQDAVVAAIRALGMPYNDAPLPAGYAPAPFDPATDAPRHRRGHFVPTGQVRPVDLSALDHLGGGQ